ncbi:DUF3999 domain-containing protein [Pseudomonas citronellolis]|uniref:DUF3999 domain-containing protein n=1 Tax=Pseudomonas citronellolis TaxID=53408 RepID=UPI0023E452D5|nr:DUF3999 domain-containing protein [Pseudomonas citronellolis]MDF3935090.1 DUF3999 domain-containing protein [Pseudomonas citronellolis]
MKLFPLILCLGLAAPALEAAENAADYPLQVPLQLQGEGPWYRLQVPMSVQMAAAHADLRDLRVFDKEGEALPYALSAAPAQGSSTAHEAGARLFPLYGAEADPGQQPGLRIQRSTTGTLVEVLPDAAPAAAGERRSGWLLDAGAADFPFERLALDWSSDAEGFQHFRIEASDDLQHWRSWGDGQLARLSFNGERMDVSDVVLPGEKARYLRLSWPAGNAAVTLKAARLEGRTDVAASAPLVWSEPIAGRREQDGSYRWDLPQALPLERVRVNLDPAAQHLMAPVALSARNNAGQGTQDNWYPLARGVLYDLPLDGRQVRQDELVLGGQPVRQLRLVTDERGTGLGTAAPSLSVAMRAREMVFLVRGSAPYQLAMGKREATSASLPLSVLIPGYQADKPGQIGQASLAGTLQVAQAQDAAASGGDWKRIGLWAVLLGGVLLLGAMAFSLLRGQRSGG